VNSSSAGVRTDGDTNESEKLAIDGENQVVTEGAAAGLAELMSGKVSSNISAAYKHVKWQEASARSPLVSRKPSGASTVSNMRLNSAKIDTAAASGFQWLGRHPAGNHSSAVVKPEPW
jgi:hypothetical protein